MMRRIIKYLWLVVCLMGVPTAALAQVDLDYEAGITANAGDGDLAPSMIMANRYGTLTQGKSALLNAKIKHGMDSTARFSYGFGAEVWGGYASNADYARYDAQNASWTSNAQHPARAWLQQLYGEVKYRSLYAAAGVQQHRNDLTDAALSSGDLVLSGNARPMPGVRAGFVDYQNIPFTGGWVQINGEVGYYVANEDSWLENHYNYYNSIITTSTWFSYKRCYFRTKPSERLSVTVGMQDACQFYGNREWYVNGNLHETTALPKNFSGVWHAFVPGFGGTALGDVNYCEGNHLGSWDLAARYRLDDKQTIRAYFQKPFEDGSGIGFLNGWDALYGLEYRTSQRGIITGAVVEYLDFTNQSGPIHWAPGDFPGTPLVNEATGADDYYNNYFYNGYANRGMSIGSQFLKQTIYNQDGYLKYLDTRVRGFHASATGYIVPQLAYRAAVSYRKSWGTPFVPALEPRTATSAMIEGIYHVKNMPIVVKGQFAIDRGSLLGDNVGGMISVTYCGTTSKKTRK